VKEENSANSATNNSHLETGRQKQETYLPSMSLSSCFIRASIAAILLTYCSLWKFRAKLQSESTCARLECVNRVTSSHDARIARSNAMPCIECVLFPICLVCLCYRGQCVVYGAVAAPATPAATLGTHALVPLYPLENAAGCVRQSSLRMRAFCWHVCACDFVRHVDRLIKHKVSCVCVFGPCFLYALVHFVAGATFWLGQTSKPHLFFATSWVFACTHAHTLGYDRMCPRR